MNSEERREARYKRRKALRDKTREARLGVYDDFNRVADADNLYSAFKSSKKGVSWKESIQRYESNAMKNVLETQRKLLSGQNIQSGFVEFDVCERGKTRHIKSVHISERIVQKCLCDRVLVPILSNPLIYDNGASLKNKGIHFAIRRVIAHMSKFYRHNNNSNEGYALLLDFSKFFDSINHELLFRLLDGRIKDVKIRNLLRRFISVFGNGVSLGLGSQISQISAIFYPNSLDHFIKEKLRIKYYARYMDDLYLIHSDKKYLEYCLSEIQKICGKLRITINLKKTRIVKLSQGVPFLKGKYRLLESGKILRLPGKESSTRMRRKLKKFKRLIDARKMTYLDLRTAYQSWRGNYKRRFDAYYRLRSMDVLYNNLFILKHRESIK